jgi:hypothetical protein
MRYHAFVYYAIVLTLIETPTTERKGELNASIQAFGDRAPNFPSHWVIGFSYRFNQ